MKRNACKILAGKPEGNRPLGRPSRRWEDSFTVDPREMYWEVVGRVHVPEDVDYLQAFVNTVMKVRVP
jgi:hypothetical protein